MLVAVVLLAIVAAGLAVALAMAARRLRDERRRTAAAEEQAATTARELAAMTAARARADEERAVAETRVTDAETAAAEAAERARLSDERTAVVEAERDAAQQEAAAAAAAQQAAEARAVEWEQRLAASEAAASARAPAAAGELDAQVAWSLERARSERTYRQSVAVGPVDGSVLAEAADPLLEALQIDLDAAREDVGAVVELDAELPGELSAAGAFLTLRAVQELLADVVRRSESTVLRVRADGADVVVDVESVDEHGAPVTPARVPAPPSAALEPTERGVRIRNAVASGHAGE